MRPKFNGQFCCKHKFIFDKYLMVQMGTCFKYILYKGFYIDFLLIDKDSNFNSFLAFTETTKNENV